MSRINSFQTDDILTIAGQNYHYYSLKKLEQAGLKSVHLLPKTLKILLEQLLRNEDGSRITSDDITTLANWAVKPTATNLLFSPARVLMQDFTGVPAIVDLAAMRAAMVSRGGDPNKVNPLTPVDLIIDHSVQVDEYANNHAYTDNVHLEMQRNRERYEFLRWGQQAFDHFRVVPPGTGICHQVNLEYLGKVVWSREIDGKSFAYPDTLVGTDSHTTMINGLGILGWGVGGIEAEAAMLGQPISMLTPEVIGFEITGRLQEGITATDLVLTITQILRSRGVVDKFVEFYGQGLAALTLPDRATVANMAPEYGATCGFFPVDQETLDYLALTGRDENQIALVEAYCKAQGLWRDETSANPVFTDTLHLDLAEVKPSLAGPRRPQDRVLVSDLPQAFAKHQEALIQNTASNPVKVEGGFELDHGAMVIAAITSCTNTSNPSVLMAAGLLAKKACEKGLSVKPWVKTSLAPGSKVVTSYLEKSGLQQYLNQLGFNLVGYGCTTCIGNSGPLHEPIAKAIDENGLVVSAVLSGNRNFEGRIHPQVKANWLASPPFVVAYALAGTSKIDLHKEPLGTDKNGQPVFLKDIWPTNAEVHAQVITVRNSMYQEQYADVFKGDSEWQNLPTSQDATYQWRDDSTYIQHPPFFMDQAKPADIQGARILAILGDSITTDHISPAGSIGKNTPAGQYLMAENIQPADFNSYGARRGNHQVMVRGTFANIRLRNQMTPDREGGFTRCFPSGEEMSIYDASQRYLQSNTPLVIFAGKEYGTGSSRDWAAKGTRLLGVKVVVAQSYERIHRSNLIGMGVLPLEFMSGTDHKSLGLTGSETISIMGISSITPGCQMSLRVVDEQGTQRDIPLHCRIDTQDELQYYQHGGILQYVLEQLV
ncbi:MAG: aconitate hydratase AcnA [Gammaproteobacteria bacterium]|nr:aconitate hydratase AcnA [Gammaproteobacteria bacterium]